MEARELRIGNLVSLYLGIDDEGPNYKELEINGIMNQLGLSYYLLKNTWVEISNNIEPIPLTEDWLKRFGFKFKNGYGYPFKHGYITKQDKYWVYHNICIKIEYVHQLQNLYFALTGEELKLKEDEN